MAISNAAPPPGPPLAKISMIGIWAETALYGINCVMYGLCMFVLLRGGKVPTLRWVLLVTCTILFLLCTIHIGASLRQLLEAFVYAPDDVSDYSTVFWLDYTSALCVLKNIVYDTVAFALDFILLWRLYVVFMSDWRVVIFPLILMACGIGTTYAITAMTALSNVNSYGSVVSNLVILASVCDMIFNTYSTVAIAWRLWRLGRGLTSLTATRANRYAFSIYIVVQSGAISSAAYLVVLALYESKSPALVAALNIALQLAGLTPLLIIVQVGLTGRYHIPFDDSLKSVFAAQNETTFRVEVPREQDFRNGLPLHTTLSHSSGPAHV